MSSVFEAFIGIVFSHIRRKIAGNTGQGRLLWKILFFYKGGVCVCVCVY